MECIPTDRTFRVVSVVSIRAESKENTFVEMHFFI